MAPPGAAGAGLSGGMHVSSRAVRAATVAALLTGTGLLPAAGVSAARAQSLPSPFISDQVALFRSDVAGARPAPDADREGTRLGSLRLNARLNTAVAYDSNILNLPDLRGSDVPVPGAPGVTLGDLAALADLPLDDVVFEVAPRVDLTSDWQRHAVQLTAGGQIERFADNAALGNYETWNVGLRTRFDLGATTELALDGAVAQDVEARGVSGLLFAAGDPIGFREDRVGAGLATRGGRWSARVAGGWLQRHYDDFQFLTLVPVPLDFRDIELWSVNGSLGYQLRPGLDLFVRGAAGFTRSLADDARLTALGAVRRDADGYAVTAGLRGELTPLLIAEVAAGWQRRDFAIASFADYDGLTYDAKLDWYPTPLISLRLRTRQDFENSGLPGVPGILLRDTSATLYYEATRRLLLSTGVDWQYRQYRATPLATDSYEFSGRAELRLNRRFSAALFVRHRRRSSNDSSVLPSYAGTIIGAALTTRL